MAQQELVSEEKLQQLAQQIDPSVTLDPEVVAALQTLATTFVDNTVLFACQLAAHRGSSALEAKDVLLHLERNLDIKLAPTPGVSGVDTWAYSNGITDDLDIRMDDTPEQLSRKQQLKQLQK